jgi:hypothetical protein
MRSRGRASPLVCEDETHQDERESRTWSPWECRSDDEQEANTDGAQPNSDVEADEALGRCAPSGLRSLTPVVRQTRTEMRNRRKSGRLCRV